jgi:lipopolysaccharide transport system ATP-binding protein
MYYVSNFCQRALWMREGRIEELGEANEVIRAYESFLLKKSEARELSQSGEQPGVAPDGGTPNDEAAPRLARIATVRLDGGRALRSRTLVAHGEPWRLKIEWQTEDPDLQFHLAVGVDRTDGVQVVAFSTLRDELPAFTGSRQYHAALEMPRMPLIKGEYTVYVYLMDESNLHPYDVKILESAFVVDNASYEIGLIKAEHHWQTTEPESFSVPQETLPVVAGE